MIRVTVELVPFGDESKAKVIGLATIANDAVGSMTSGGRLGDYDVVLSKREPKLKQTWKRGRVEGFERRRLGAWDLLYRALHATVGDRNRIRESEAEQSTKEIELHLDNDGYDRLWGWFGLSRAAWLTLPRVLMHEMPRDWQGRMADLLAQYEVEFPGAMDLNMGTRVQATTLDGKLAAMPSWLCEYRRPDQPMIDSMRRASSTESSEHVTTN